MLANVSFFYLSVCYGWSLCSRDVKIGCSNLKDQYSPLLIISILLMPPPSYPISPPFLSYPRSFAHILPPFRCLSSIPIAFAVSSYDARLFNQSAGMDSGFGAEDGYGVYSKPMFNRGEAQSVYRPKKDDGDAWGDADQQVREFGDKRKGTT